MKPKAGQLWVSTLQPDLGFRVVSVNASSVSVEVTRRRRIGGELVISPAVRDVPTETFARFAQAYEVQQ